MGLLITYLVIAIGVSFLCSILEAVLLSVTSGHIETTLQKHPKRGAVLEHVKTNLDQSISGILILNTFAHTMGAAGVGSQASQLFGSQWEGLIALVLTLAILYFSEIIPKTLGANYWRQLAIPSAHLIKWMTTLLFPLVWFSSKLTQLLKNDKKETISREEIAAMATISHRGGSLAAQENDLLNSILNLKDVRTEDIATPRLVVHALEAELTVTEALEKLNDSPFTRIPVYEKSIDHISGMVTNRQLLETERSGHGDQTVGSIATPVFDVSEHLPVLKLIDLFIKRREHLFIVRDKFGQTQAIVTLEDALETILGREIMDESDTVEDMQELAKTKFKERQMKTD